MDPITDVPEESQPTTQVQPAVMQEPDQTVPDTSTPTTAAEPLQVDATVDLSVSSQNPGRCAVCDWPLDNTTRGTGCTKESCSYRPENPAEYEKLRQRRLQLGAEGKLPTTEQAFYDAERARMADKTVNQEDPIRLEE